MDLTGKLLVALPILLEDTFRRSVVLVLRHDGDGAFGLVLNRPTATGLEDALPRWVDRAAAPAVVFVGGPVQQELAIALGAGDAGLETVDLDADPALAAPNGMRVFAGYAGWSSGQLENELVEGAWVIVEAEPGDPFRRDAEDLWHLVLARQPDPTLRRLALLPDDLTVN